MKALWIREKILVSVIALCCVSLIGCVSKPGTTSDAAPQIAPRQTQTPEQRQQEQARVVQIIKAMTPEQRAAHFKAHPEDATALAR